MARRKIDDDELVERITFRVPAAYQSLLATRAKGLNLSAHQYGKFATMAMADHEMLELRRELEQLRTEMKDHFRLLREVLNHALYEDAC